MIYPATGGNVKSSAAHGNAGATQIYSAQTYSEIVYREPYVTQGKEWSITTQGSCAFATTLAL